MVDSESQQVTSKTPATKQKIQNVSLRAKLSLKKRNWPARHRKKLLSRHRASLQANNPTHHLCLTHQLNCRKLRAPKKF